jgi:hypothetical protein
MILGFTGTRCGMTEEQLEAFRRLFSAPPYADPDEFHHGCCPGSDEDATVAVYDLTCDDTVIQAHPSTLAHLTSQKAIDLSREDHPPLPPLDRNRVIVNACHVLIACPKGPEEQRSGTWATVRYARKRGKRIVIIWPDGTITAPDH